VAADYTIAIIGSGPAGTSAAVRAAVEGKSHILLERAPHLNDTIFKYQKRKLVMATPEILPLRSDLAFKEESREEVIETWTGGVEGARVNLRLNAEVTAVTGRLGNFEIALAGGEKLTAEYIVLAIGVQGNIRESGPCHRGGLSNRAASSSRVTVSPRIPRSRKLTSRKSLASTSSARSLAIR